MKVMALSCVPKMLSPAAHHGAREPALKKSSVPRTYLEKRNPCHTTTTRYSASTA